MVKEIRWRENKKNIKTFQKSNIITSGLKLIADIFIPMIPAIILAGLFFGFASLTEQLIKQRVLANTETAVTVILVLKLFSGYF